MCVCVWGEGRWRAGWRGAGGGGRRRAGRRRGRAGRGRRGRRRLVGGHGLPAEQHGAEGGVGIGQGQGVVGPIVQGTDQLPCNLVEEPGIAQGLWVQDKHRVHLNAEGRGILQGAPALPAGGKQPAPAGRVWHVPDGGDGCLDAALVDACRGKARGGRSGMGRQRLAPECNTLPAEAAPHCLPSTKLDPLWLPQPPRPPPPPFGCLWHPSQAAAPCSHATCSPACKPSSPVHSQALPHRVPSS